MVSLKRLVDYTNEYLNVNQFKDYCPNGLQIEGRSEVRRIVSGVTASLDLIEAAIEASADLVLVHHGYFWKGENPAVVGIKKRRLAALLKADVSLLAYHLPLDAHAELGNNACLAGLLDINVDEALNEAGIGNVGQLGSPLTVDEMSQRLSACLGSVPLHVGAGPQRIQKVAWCTGAAQGYIDDAVAKGADAYISGEISEPTLHQAKENGIHYFAAGHHATERYGVQALGEHLSDRFDIDHLYIEKNNPA